MTHVLGARRALVTGGASGIGASTARRLVDEGAHVVVADIDETGGRAHSALIGAEFAHLDVTDLSAWRELIDVSGPFDIVVLNAGVSTQAVRMAGAGRPDPPLGGLDADIYRRVMSVNVDGVVFGIHAVLPAMLAAGIGDVVVTASIAGLVPMAPDPVYGLSKHAVIGYVRSIAGAVEGQGVAISAICPGFVDTALVGGQARMALADRGVELLRPVDVAEVVIRALVARCNGAQWIVWAGQPVRRYVWAPVVEGLR